ncbi:formimidoylglutamase [Streptococcus ictaluri]|uniref:Formimidoylglutamase n=1 Tax=Streptococcus ictaluri 707-05 TaxID=764299 RepID=G5K5G4_9STRE|nr:formimidoylglutamase [Streptococcus ictaluri]EHI69168.1 formimidoylglutamase [Streptococcus ictaluri 707-05]
MLEDYYPVSTIYYHGGIDDDLYTAKWGMVMTFLDLNDPSLTPFEGTHFALIGFKSDKGVYINNGRVGAVESPAAIRSQLAKFPWHLGSQVNVYDVGNIDGPNRSLQELQASLSKAIQRMRELNLRPIVLGGGHETAYGHYSGLLASLPEEDKELAVINLDAHFDLRPYDQNGPNSGTGFRQMFDDAVASDRLFKYLVLGIQEHNNNLFLFDFVAKSKGIAFLTGQDIYKLGYQKVCQIIDHFLEGQKQVYLTIDMDCFAVGAAPGVSAIQSLGVDPNLAVLVLQHIAASGKLLGFDIVEVSPPHDIDHHTANLAATFIFYLVQIMAQHP